MPKGSPQMIWAQTGSRAGQKIDKSHGRQADLLQYTDRVLVRSQSDTVGPWSTETPATEAELASLGGTGRHGDSHRY